MIGFPRCLFLIKRLLKPSLYLRKKLLLNDSLIVILILLASDQTVLLSLRVKWRAHYVD